ncbi:hypothetical protein D3C87_377750 [compost metagenome]
MGKSVNALLFEGKLTSWPAIMSVLYAARAVVLVLGLELFPFFDIPNDATTK